MIVGGHVYFLRPVSLPGPIKIGCSKLPMDRLMAYSAWSPYPLEIAVTIPGFQTLERNIHDCFAHARSHHEWFHPVPELLEAIAKLRDGVPVHEAIDLSKRTVTPRPVQRGRLSDERRRYLSYCHKARWAEKRAERSINDPNVYCRIPQDAYDIIDRWRGGYRSGPPVQPTADEIARLDQVIADPVDHCEPVQRSLVRAA